jgi:hypothetical protein
VAERSTADAVDVARKTFAISPIAGVEPASETAG